MNTLAMNIKELCVSLGADTSGDGEYDLLIDSLDLALNMASSNPELGNKFHQLLGEVIKKEGWAESDFPHFALLTHSSKLKLCAYRGGSHINYDEANRCGGVYDIASGTAQSLADSLHASLAAMDVLGNDEAVFVVIQNGIPTELVDARFGCTHEELLSMIKEAQ